MIGNQSFTTIEWKEGRPNIYTKIISMPNSIRTCTVFYKYSALSHSFCSRHTFNITSQKRTTCPQFIQALGKENYPLDLLITVEPIRIHYWSMDKMIDYQQDIMMKECVKYEWKIDAKTLKENDRYLQSDVFGVCWCMEIKEVNFQFKYEKNLFLKLLRLAPNINRIQVNCSLKVNMGMKTITLKDKKLEFTFVNEGVCKPLYYPYMLQTHKGDISFEIEVRIKKVFVINDVDDFETNDTMIPIDKWSQYGIITRKRRKRGKRGKRKRRKQKTLD